MTQPRFIIGKDEYPDAAAWYAAFVERVTDRHKAEAFARINGPDVRALAKDHRIAEAWWIIDDLQRLGAFPKAKERS